MSEEETKLLYRLDERVDDIGERLSALEGSFEKGKARNLKKYLTEYGGILALIFSIMIGAFTIYDEIILNPRREETLKVEAFRNDINTLVQLAAQISSLDWSNNPSAARQQAQTLTPQRIALIERVEQFAKQKPRALKFADRLLLVSENESFSWHEKALMHAKAALDVSADPLQTANAYWAMARISGNLNQLPEMRQNYQKAIDQFNSVGLNSTAGSVMQLYTQWIYKELVHGKSCAPAAKVFGDMKSLYARPEVWPATKVSSEREFRMMILNAPRTCDLQL